MKKLNGVYMFLFIAILWYLHVLIPNTNHNVSEVRALIDAGNKALKNNTEHVIKAEHVQSFLNSAYQHRDEVEQLNAEEVKPVLD